MLAMAVVGLKSVVRLEPTLREDLLKNKSKRWVTLCIQEKEQKLGCETTCCSDYKHLDRAMVQLKIPTEQG